jgi:hypothetical protein
VSKLYYYCVTQEKSVNSSIKVFENCMEGYIMVAQRREIGPDLRGHKEREGGVRIMMSPFRGFYDAQSEVDRLFNETFGGLSRGRGRQGGGQLAQWAPAVDVLTKDGDLVIRAELPGLKQEDVDITLQNGVLTISGEHKVDQEEERGN